MPSPAGLAAVALDGLGALVRFAPDLAVVALLLLAAFLAGLAPVARLRPTPDAALVLATGLGLSVVGTGAALLALAGLFRPPFLAALLLLAAAPGAVFVARRTGRVSRRRRAFVRRVLLPAILLVGAATLPVFVVALYPATGFDGTAYHLPHAAKTVETGTLGPFTTVRFWWFPQLNGMFFALALSAGTARTAQILGAALFSLGGLAAFALARRAAGRGAGLLAAAAWLAAPLAAENAWGASLDATLSFFVLAGALALQLLNERGGGGRALLAGALLGAAAGTKLFGATYVAAGAVVVAAVALRERRPGLLARFCGAAALACGLWYGRTWALVGNPFYPGASRLFGNRGPIPDEQLATFSAEMTATFGKPRTPGALLALPFEAVAWPCRLSESRIGLHPSFPLLLAAAPLALAGRRRLAAPLLLAGAGVGAALATWPTLRYALPALALLTATGSAGLAKAVRAAAGVPAARRVPAAVAVAVLVLPPGTIAWAAYYSVWRGPVPRDERSERLYVEKWLPGTDGLFALNRELGARYAVYSLACDNRSFYADGAFLADPFGPDRAPDVLHEGASAAQVRLALARFGATHVLLCPGTRLDARWKALGDPAWAVRQPSGGGTALYALTPEARPSVPGGPGVTPRRAGPTAPS